VTLPESISSRLERFHEYVTALKTYRQVGTERFRHEASVRYATERCLHLAIESVLDIASHLIAAKGCREPRDYEDVITVLGETGMIPAALREQLRGMGKFRNLLVHEYVDLDHDQVYESLSDVETLEQLAVHLVQAIEQL
jgi:uncharacterized protein YutE (UPF0331/DUF86 family)